MSKPLHEQPQGPLLANLVFYVKQLVMQVGDSHDLSMMQLSVLIKLEFNEPLAMNALSQHFKCDASNITGIADRLEARSLTVRLDHLHDRRIKMIGLTAEGQALRKVILSEVATAENELLDSALSSAEKHMLKELVGKLIKTTNP